MTFASPAWGQWIAGGVPLTTAPRNQDYAATLSDGAHGVFVAWRDDQVGTYRLFCQHIDADGHVVPGWGAQGILIGTSSCGDPANLTSDGAGGVIVTWLSANRDTIYGARLSASGALAPGWASNGLALVGGVGMVAAAGADGDGSGGFFLAWSDNHAGVWRAYAQRFLANGAVADGWPASGLLLCNATSRQFLYYGTSESWPSEQVGWRVALDGAGGAVFVWEDRAVNAGGRADIYAQRVDAAGNLLWGAAGVPVCRANYFESSPQVIADGTGGTLVAWTDFRGAPDGDYDIYLQRLRADGTPSPGWVTDGVPVCTAIRIQENPRLVADGAGGGLLIWDDLRTNSGGDVYAQHVTGEGQIAAGWPADGMPVSTPLDHQQNQVIASDSNGGLVVAWNDYRNGVAAIYAQRITGAGTKVWGDDGKTLYSGALNIVFPAIAGDGQGGAIVAWQDWRLGSGYYDVYAQRVFADGRVGSPLEGTVTGVVRSLCDGVLAPSAGTDVRLLQNGGLIASAVTAADGSYRFTAVPLGSYSVSVTAAADQRLPIGSRQVALTLAGQAAAVDAFLFTCVPQAACVPGEFQSEPIAAAGNIGGRNSLALDPQGRPHVVFHDFDAGTLRHAVRTSSGWQFETVDVTGTGEQYNSCGIGPDGVLQVVYYDDDGQQFKYARREANGWVIELITSGRYVGITNSLALDPASGTPHVSYWDYSYGLRYARRGPSGWTLEAVAPYPAGTWNSIALDHSGVPSIAYSFSSGPSRLYYASRASGTWVRQLVDATSGQSVGEACALAVDANGVPHISYHDNARFVLKYAERGASGWTKIDLNQPYDGGQYTSIAVADNGDVHVSAMGFSPTYRVNYAHRTAGQWSVVAVDSSGSGAAGMYTHLVLDACGQPWISYYNQNPGMLVKLAEPRPTADVTPPSVTAPANASYQCPSQVPAADPAQATASDDSGPPTVTVAESRTGFGSPASPLRISRTFTATDAAGNSASAVQTITVVDDTPPSIQAPPALEVTAGPGTEACGSVTVLVDTGVLGAPTASDNCSTPTVTRSGAPAGGAFPFGVTTLTYTATDSAGNSASATQSVTVRCPVGSIAGVVRSTCDGSSAASAGTTVKLLHEGTPFRQVVTGADGSYRFDDVRLGTYIVAVTPPPGYGVPIDTRLVTLASEGAVLPVEPFVFTCLLGDIAGRIEGSCNGATNGLAGVTVDVYRADASGLDVLVATAASDAAGLYRFEDLALGDYSVGIVLPLGYATTAASQPISLSQPDGLVHAPAFVLACQPIANQVRGMGYWKHQTDVYLTGKGSAQETLADLLRYVDLIVQHFNENLVNPVIVYVPGASNTTDKLLQLQRLMTVNKGGTALDRAKQQLLSLMLNVVSAKISQVEVISDNGATVSQAITFCHDLMVDASPGNDGTAQSIAEMVNNGVRVPAGMVPAETRAIAYGIRPISGDAHVLRLDTVHPNPSHGIFTIEFSLRGGGPASLEVVDVAGRRILRQEVGSLGGGRHSFAAGARSPLAPGVYLVRLSEGERSESRLVAVVR